MNWFRRHAVQLEEIGRGAERVPAAIRLIAGLALLKAALFLIGGLAIGRFIENEGVTLIMAVADWLHIKPEWQPLVRMVHGLSSIDLRSLQLLDLACFVYATLYLIQGIGLWFDRWWAEWLTVIMTSLLIPFEIYELMHQPRISVAVVLALNLVVVGYLIRRLRQRRQQQQQTQCATAAAPADRVPPR